MLRNLIAKLSRTMSSRIVAIRCKRQAPIKLSFEPTGRVGSPDSTKNLFIAGETIDMSDSGIAFMVAAIRVKENYLVGQGRILNAELDLPNGKISMKVVGQRYELVGEHLSTERYAIGAEIVEISDDDRNLYQEFMRLGDALRRNTGELKFIGNR